MTISGESKRHRSRRLPKKNAAGACRKVRRPADRERLNVNRLFLKPCRVVGDEGERTKTDLVAQEQTAAGRHDEGEDCKLVGSRLDACPTVSANCRGYKSDSRCVGYERMGRALATARLYEFRPLCGGGNSPTSQCSRRLLPSVIWNTVIC